MANKRKTTSAIVAGVTALALLLGGTFAWTSISQQAKNEAIVDINPGGRLHDDFNGTNKDVYVENFGDEITGVDIYARIRLDQYFEVGQEAGLNKDNTGRNVDVKLGGAINDVTTWETYIPGDLSDTSKVQANANWQWNLGRTTEDGDLPYYMPTFNKNKDSLAADINGTYEGTVEGDIVHYDDYVQYGSAEQNAADDKIIASKTDTEVYDHDSNTTEEAEGTTEGGVPAYSTDSIETPIDDAHVRYAADEVHTATQITSGSTVMTMAAWNALTDEEKKATACWVYDTDGWAYWSQPIAPGKTTGLLLDSITLSRVPDDNYYYGINVVAQFATKGDLSAFENDGGGMTDSALDLLDSVAELEDQWVIEGPASAAAGESVAFTATLMKADVALENQPEITWELGANTTADETALTLEGNTLTIAKTVEPASVIEVVAKTADGTVVGSKTVYVSFSVEVTDPADYDGSIANGQSVTYKVKGDYTADELEWMYSSGESRVNGTENVDGTYTVTHDNSNVCKGSPMVYKVYLVSNPDVYCTFEVVCEHLV